MIQKLKLVDSNVVYASAKITKVEIVVAIPEDILGMYFDYVRPVEDEKLSYFEKIDKYTKFSGVAKKRDGDALDPMVGISVAEARAWIKAKKRYRAMLKALYSKLFAVRQDIVETVEDLDSDIQHNLDYISKK